MFGFGNNDKEEKLWNLALFNFYGTDRELKSAVPFLFVLFVVFILGYSVYVSIS